MRLLSWVRVPTLLALWWRRITHKPVPAKEQARPKSFLLVRLDALGDLVLTTPVFRELKRSFPNSQLTVVAQNSYKSILTTNPHIDEVIGVQPFGSKWLPLPKGAANLLGVLRSYWNNLRGRRFDVAISPRWDIDENLATFLCLLAHAAVRVGYSEQASPGKRIYNRGFDRAYDVCLQPGPLQHEVLRNLAVVEALGGAIQDRALEIHLAQQDREYAQRELPRVSKSRVIVVLGIGAQTPGRRWPLERYSALVSELAMQYSLQIVVTCAPAEHEDARHLAAMLRGRVIISDTADIRQTCALLAESDLFIGNDTGAAHLAAAMNCPAIVISRHPRAGDPEHPNSPARFAPFGAKACVLQPEHGFEGCTGRCIHEEPHCILKISVPEVVNAAKLLLADRRKSDSGPEMGAPS